MNRNKVRKSQKFQLNSYVIFVTDEKKLDKEGLSKFEHDSFKITHFSELLWEDYVLDDVRIFGAQFLAICSDNSSSKN